MTPPEVEAPAEPPRSSGLAFLALALKGLGAIAVACLGSAYGIGAYELFSKVFSRPVAGVNGLMLVSFLAGIPLCIGILVGYLSSQRRLAGPGGSSALAMLALGLFIFAAGAFMREGIVCIVMATPLFVLMAIVGVLIGFAADVFGGSGAPKLLSVALVLPFFAAPFEEDRVPATKHQATRQSIYIAAPASTVWGHLNFPVDIQPSELAGAFAYRIGVPFPLEARTVSGRLGGTRELRWERGIRFEEEITAWEPDRHIAWNYRFGPDSFPEGSLDDHIVIGGRFFNLESTAYRLAPEGSGTRLTIEVVTSVTTNFNGYAGWWARFLVEDTSKAILKFYKKRAETRSAPAGAG